jgi:hypothetical protein
MTNRPACFDSCGTEAEQFYFVLHFSHYRALLFVVRFKSKRCRIVNILKIK